MMGDDGMSGRTSLFRGGWGWGAADKAIASSVGVGRETLAPEIFGFCQVSQQKRTARWNGKTDDVLQERGGVHFEACHFESSER